MTAIHSQLQRHRGCFSASLQATGSKEWEPLVRLGAAQRAWLSSADILVAGLVTCWRVQRNICLNPELLLGSKFPTMGILDDSPNGKEHESASEQMAGDDCQC
jgi:hypothetical protein